MTDFVYCKWVVKWISQKLQPNSWVFYLIQPFLTLTYCYCSWGEITHMWCPMALSILWIILTVLRTSSLQVQQHTPTYNFKNNLFSNTNIPHMDFNGTCEDTSYGKWNLRLLYTWSYQHKYAVLTSK